MSNVAIPKELTPDVIMEMGREFIDAMMKIAPIEEFLKFHKPDEVLNHYKPEQRLTGLTEEQIRAYLEQLQRSKN